MKSASEASTLNPEGRRPEELMWGVALGPRDRLVNINKIQKSVCLSVCLFDRQRYTRTKLMVHVNILENLRNAFTVKMKMKTKKKKKTLFDML